MKYKSFKIVTVIAVLFLLFACEKSDPFSPNAPGAGSTGSEEELKGSSGRGQVTVMTWNIYVGADVDVVLGATDPTQIPGLVAAAYQELLSTNFEERAGTIAQFIQEYEPHLIGLQEVSLIQRFSPVSGPIEQFDYFEILMDKLGALGLNYQVAGKVDNADVTVPMIVNPITFEVEEYVRLLDSDVVLARQDVAVSDVIEKNYQAVLPTPFGFVIPRGYVSLNATVGQKDYRFVNTHLESSDFDNVRYFQAGELVNELSGETQPIIMVGDFNTRAPSSLDPAGPTYQFLVGEEAGYTDVWPHNLVGSEGEGFTSSHDSDLRNPVPHLDHRIDLIFVRNQGSYAGQEPVQAFVLGDELNERTPSGMWPSDHAGVVAKLHILEPAQLATSNSTASAY